MWQTVGHQQLDNMEVCCTFRSIAWGVSWADSRDRKQDWCYSVANIFYLQALVSAFIYWSRGRSRPYIICRSGIFTKSGKGNNMTINALHRAKLGLGWARGASTRCRIPPSRYNQGKVFEKGSRNRSKRIQNAFKQNRSFSSSCIRQGI